MMETKKRYIVLPNSNCTKNLKLTVKEKGHKQENKKISNEMKHLRCRCLGGMTLYPQTQQLQMHIYRISVQQSLTMQCFSYAIRSQSMLTTIHWACLQCLAQHTREIAFIACLHNFSGPALLSCSEILTYKLLGSQLWIALPFKIARNSSIANR